ncbi:class I SAM-dependent methyltransferase [Erysipelothrix sp. HDW6A]|uniref:class I SAM-dependent methyltransferase n=1 Tax=Erysipelothrix sp. HDW6A TaxID=2714928 RepID=UPI00140E22CB|nr:class I SAM-dependent methyltransferase [Erysipelothrix sp. HDW6A]QIK56396.1 class I SAM-dependent methyltransferase [Erysipelothrix sp. HDW6A]
MNNKFEFWLQEEAASFSGWDFSYLDNRWEMEDLPWDYSEIVKNYLSPDLLLLDMGTAGGENLLSFNHPFNNTSVTEGYEPNYQLCKKILEPLGVTVKFCDDDLLPYDSCSFDIIMNRHESYNLSEVLRTLKPGGVFITQQVGAMNNYKLSEFLLDIPHILKIENTLDHNIHIAENLGFEILNKNEFYARLRFFDIGALVYYAKIIEWEFPNFSVSKHFGKLSLLDDILDNQGFIDTIEHRYLLVLRK